MTAATSDVWAQTVGEREIRKCYRLMNNSQPSPLGRRKCSDCKLQIDIRSQMGRYIHMYSRWIEGLTKRGENDICDADFLPQHLVPHTVTVMADFCHKSPLEPRRFGRSEVLKHYAAMRPSHVCWKVHQHCSLDGTKVSCVYQGPPFQGSGSTLGH